MVYHGFPQGPGSRSLTVNANHPPQGAVSKIGVATFNDESYVSGGDRGSVAYVIAGERGIVDYEDLI